MLSFIYKFLGALVLAAVIIVFALPFTFWCVFVSDEEAERVRACVEEACEKMEAAQKERAAA